jgi:polyisoprenoid-binding protein YceI
MNKFMILAATAALMLAACGDAPAPSETEAPAAAPAAETVTPPVKTLVDGDYTVAADASEVVWIGRKVTGEHRGNISIADGKFRVSNGVISGGTLTMDMTSMTNTDLDAENGANLLGHLASADFFDTANFPTATFEIKSFAPSEIGGTMKGMLTIKGITQPQSFEVTASSTDGGMDIRGMMKIDRTAFDIKYGSGSFFENLGDKAIDDLFELGFFIKANS